MVERRSSKKTTQLGNKEDRNPRKFYSQFLFKALILAVFCSIVPVFLSQTPELANQTRLLELLHLVFVGLAVSYGLFSRRNYDGGGVGSNDNDHKADHNNTTNPHAYVPKLLEVSSVFNAGHESESEPSDDSSCDHRKTQTWRNKYQMKSPEVVLSNRENQTRFVDRVSPGVREKPLLLPVRSLNYSRVTDHSGGPWERVRSKRELLKSLGDDDNSDVLPSPIPWRSRSSSSSTTEVESQTSIKNLATVESQPLIKNLTSSSPRKSPPLPKLTTESGEVEMDEDTVRKQRFRPSPPSPPPPPPLPAFYNSASRKDNPPGVNRIVESRESVQKKKFSGGEFHPSPPPPPPPPPPMDYYKSPPAKLRASSERRKSSEQKMKRNSPKKVWWSDPIAESKELRVTREEDTEKNDGRGFLGSKASEESEDEERRRREAEVHEDDEHSEIEERNGIEEEGVCGNNSDVDKKADEFIAKFREQIRLQRIESIKRSTNKISANSSK